MTAGRRVLILSAGMGAGHDRVAAELARRLVADGAEAEIIDVLQLLPLRLGPMLRSGYQWVIRHAPWLYEATYQLFFVAKRAPSTSPLTLLAAAPLGRLARRHRPDEVVSTFHLAAQVTGWLRRRGRIRARSTVLVTDFAVHRLWLHPGNDRYLCPNPAMTGQITAMTGRPALCTAPVVRPRFRPRVAECARTRARIGAHPGDLLVLVSAGSWGVGAVRETARILVSSGRYRPVVLCGHNARLRNRLGGGGTVLALGWRDDVPELMSAAHALVDNAAGLTCVEAFAAGLPVVSYRPIPGHGRDGALAMARAGFSVHAPDAAALLDALDRLRDERQRDLQIARASALFTSLPAVAALMSAPADLPPAPAGPATGRAGSRHR
ncbi:MGDG synthase family glycosyltransferase [Sphaerisporangium viridialbum]|uniref:MGDG synthase family glycosyltransferase n=1 Tax=Sphaerisporangium viridialbum TaxID=46189 RepID=UPI003C75F7A3